MADLYKYVADILFKKEIDQIVYVQNRFEGLEAFLSYISIATHPRITYIYIIPIFAAFDLKLFSSIMLAASSSNFIIVILKWMIAEDRPYWWVQETEMYNAQNRPELHQTYLTCETSGGNPSGHVMFQAALLYVLAKYAVDKCTAEMRFDKKNIEYSIWIIYGAALCLVTISRMYFACHFFHQCLLGGFLGYHLSTFVNTNTSIQSFYFDSKLRTMILFGLGLIMISLCFYFVQILFGVDPQWTIRIAFKWCKNPYDVNPDTTPLFSLIRVIGVIFGVIFSAPLKERCSTVLDLKRSLPLVICISFIYYIGAMYVPKYNGVWIFYFATFAINCSYTWSLINIISTYGGKKFKVF